MARNVGSRVLTVVKHAGSNESNSEASCLPGGAPCRSGPPPPVALTSVLQNGGAIPGAAAVVAAGPTPPPSTAIDSQRGATQRFVSSESTPVSTAELQAADRARLQALAERTKQQLLAAQAVVSKGLQDKTGGLASVEPNGAVDLQAAEGARIQAIAERTKRQILAAQGGDNRSAQSSHHSLRRVNSADANLLERSPIAVPSSGGPSFDSDRASRAQEVSRARTEALADTTRQQLAAAKQSLVERSRPTPAETSDSVPLGARTAGAVVPPRIPNSASLPSQARTGKSGRVSSSRPNRDRSPSPLVRAEELLARHGKPQSDGGDGAEISVPASGSKGVQVASVSASLDCGAEAASTNEETINEFEVDEDDAIVSLRDRFERLLRAADVQFRKADKVALDQAHSLRRLRAESTKAIKPLEATLTEAKSELATATQKAEARLRSLRDSIERAESVMDGARIDISKAEARIARVESETVVALESVEKLRAEEVERAAVYKAVTSFFPAGQSLLSQRLRDAQAEVAAELACAESLRTEVSKCEGAVWQIMKARVQMSKSAFGRTNPEEAGADDSRAESVEVEHNRKALELASEVGAERSEIADLDEELLHGSRALAAREAQLAGLLDAQRISLEAQRRSAEASRRELEGEVVEVRQEVEDVRWRLAEAEVAQSEQAERKEALASAFWTEHHAVTAEVKAEMELHRHVAALLREEASAATARNSFRLPSVSPTSASTSRSENLPSPVPRVVDRSILSAGSFFAAHERRERERPVVPALPYASAAGAAAGVSARSRSSFAPTSTDTVGETTSSRSFETTVREVPDQQTSIFELEMRVANLEEFCKVELRRLDSEHASEISWLHALALSMQETHQADARALMRARVLRLQKQVELWRLRQAHERRRRNALGAAPGTESEAAWTARVDAAKASLEKVEEWIQKVGHGSSIFGSQSFASFCVPPKADDIARFERAYLCWGDEIEEGLQGAIDSASPSALVVATARGEAQLRSLHSRVASLRRCREAAGRTLAHSCREASLRAAAAAAASAATFSASASRSGPRPHDLKRISEANRDFASEVAVARQGCAHLLCEEAAQLKIADAAAQLTWATTTELELQSEEKAQQSARVECLVSLSAALDREANLEETLRRHREGSAQLRRDELLITQEQASLAAKATLRSRSGRELEDVYTRRQDEVQRLCAAHEKAVSRIQDLHSELGCARSAEVVVAEELSEVQKLVMVEMHAERMQALECVSLEMTAKAGSRAAATATLRNREAFQQLADERWSCERARKLCEEKGKDKSRILYEVLSAREGLASAWRSLNDAEATSLQLACELDETEACRREAEESERRMEAARHLAVPAEETHGKIVEEVAAATRSLVAAQASAAAATLARQRNHQELSCLEAKLSAMQENLREAKDEAAEAAAAIVAAKDAGFARELDAAAETLEEARRHLLSQQLELDALDTFDVDASDVVTRDETEQAPPVPENASILL